MNPLSAIFGGAVGARNALYDRGVFRPRRLRGPVVSAGNIRVGGTGKTPFVILLGELLKRRGIAFDVLSRGYRRKSKGVVLVDPNGSPADFGDEPLLITRRLGVPVIVGESRYQAGLFAEQNFGPQLHILDDGFQHRALARDFDIVLVSPDDARDTLLPLGRLREPVSSLRRADAIVLTPGAVRDELHFQSHEGQLVLRVERGIETRELPSCPVAFCAIARPEKFFAQLRDAGVTPAAEMRFRDHHAYTALDIAALRRTATSSKAQGFVTTEKDAVNLGPLTADLQPLSVVRATMTLREADAKLSAILETVERRRTVRA